MLDSSSKFKNINPKEGISCWLVDIIVEFCCLGSTDNMLFKSIEVLDLYSTKVLDLE